MLDQKTLMSVLSYNSETGIFVWRINVGSRAKAGSEAGFHRPDGYISITIDKKPYFAHRLAFLHIDGSLPKMCVDHINGNRSDNSWENLREVDRPENQKNQRLSSASTTGINGVCWHKKGGKWHAQIKVNYKNISLGLYDDIKDAVTARKEADLKYRFHKNHGSKPNARIET